VESQSDFTQLQDAGQLTVNAMFSRCLRGFAPARNPAQQPVESATISGHVANRAPTFCSSPEMGVLAPRWHERHGWVRRWSA